MALRSQPNGTKPRVKKLLLDRSNHVEHFWRARKQYTEMLAEFLVDLELSQIP